MKLLPIAAIAALSATGLAAQEKALTTAEIQELLVGNTVEGIHFGTHTRQYFSPSGLTLWIKSGDETPSEARYKIEDDQYCSSWVGLWSDPEWGCFSIVHDEKQGLYYYLAQPPRTCTDGGYEERIENV
ncbi:hypothetical protein PhaeoP83_04463 (plasmid) [Phaeobacter inhibens]|jgi:hypothetical protein|uniref:Uncharacterized protein n=2 Tax=Phaeobacter TaxID=302485 RepID=A0AAN1LCT5_9RHOB|nr:MULTISPECIES: hypothetical protein [Phaeobacter]ATG46053.1 hypothetical protein PhaeoP13_04171 [Phaeobacter piscinae]AUQ52681.1 hypothetical protein PhaeoP83_04463 [Phaeobacter inhibens]AUQ56882.1 hypothetical protein PhaeoP92_04266 [Phaeobacter inhibens]AUQ68862.1 hypothetical protein PhaeoP78_04046 [Phaeobacter inhibens]AUQ80899.1 hypothetical protein PhaeoP74_04268 [Phaeobacter inhibens]